MPGSHCRSSIPRVNLEYLATNASNFIPVSFVSHALQSKTADSGQVAATTGGFNCLASLTSGAIFFGGLHALYRVYEEQKDRGPE